MEKEKKNKKSKKIIIILIIIVLLCAIIYFYKNYSSKKNSKIVYGNYSYNLTHSHGNIIEYGNEWIIYSQGNNALNLFTESQRGIYKYNKNNGQTIKISDSNGYCFNIYNNYLYYVDESQNIYTLNLDDNSNNHTLIWIDGAENTKVAYMMVVNNTIFYRDSNGGNVYQVNNKGYNRKLIAEYTASDFTFNKNEIYYKSQSDGYLYCKNLQSGETLKVLDKNVDNVSVSADNIYYTTISDDEKQNNLCCYNMSQKKEIVLQKDLSSNYVTDGEYIYYYSETNKCFYKYSINNGQKDKIIDESERTDRIQLYNGNIYYSLYEEYGQLYGNYGTTIKTYKDHTKYFNVTNPQIKDLEIKF